MAKNLPANAGDIRDVGSFPGSGRSSEGGNGNSLHLRLLYLKIIFIYLISFQ